MEATKAKKSVKLTRAEVKELRDRMSKYGTQTEAAIRMGVGRDVLLITIARGSCSGKTYATLFPNN